MNEKMKRGALACKAHAFYPTKKQLLRAKGMLWGAVCL